MCQLHGYHPSRLPFIFSARTLELKDVFTFLAIIWTCLLCVLNFGLGLILPLLLFVNFVARFEGIEAARKEGIGQVIKSHHPRRTPSTHLNSLQLSVLQLQNTSASLNPRPQFSLGNGCYYDAKMDWMIRKTKNEGRKPKLYQILRLTLILFDMLIWQSYAVQLSRLVSLLLLWHFNTGKRNKGGGCNANWQTI